MDKYFLILAYLTYSMSRVLSSLTLLFTTCHHKHLFDMLATIWAQDQGGKDSLFGQVYIALKSPGVHQIPTGPQRECCNQRLQAISNVASSYKESTLLLLLQPLQDGCCMGILARTNKKKLTCF